MTFTTRTKTNARSALAVGINVISMASLSGLLAHAQGALIKPNAGMLRYPAISCKQITFVYANKLWLVSREGGVASPLANPPGPFGSANPPNQTSFLASNDVLNPLPSIVLVAEVIR